LLPIFTDSIFNSEKGVEMTRKRIGPVASADIFPTAPEATTHGLQSIQWDGGRLVPSKIVCIGRNFVDHVLELHNEIPDELVVFNKPNSAITRELWAVRDEALHYETELCYLYLAGKFRAVAIGLDLTKRELQQRLKSKGLPWERAKAFDGSALFSPFMALESQEQSLSFSLQINGVQVQQGCTELMIHKPAQILEQVSAFMTLNDGDIVMTGTPAGVGKIPPGGRFDVCLLAGETSLLQWHWQEMGPAAD
jgi:2-keto-4-pentenoate hydratase/2-oxohepta-3-ene-1,7-dioic acid hydratase in catechol pathway